MRDPGRFARRRRMLLAAGACLISPVPALHARQEPDYPSRPIVLVVPNTPGSSVDTMSRRISAPMSASLGQPIVIENNAGSGGVIGVQQILRAPRDGHTIGVVSNNFSISPYLYKLPYDPVRDIVPISILSSGPLVLTVNPGLPVDTLQELLALARSRTGKTSLTFGSAGLGSVPHLAGALLTTLSGVELLHVPYKGMSTYITDLMSGQIDIGFMPTAAAVPLVRRGSLRPIAVTAARRAASFPDLPTIAEAGLPGYELDGSLAAIAAAGTPPAVMQRLNTAIVDAMHSPEVTQYANEQGTDIVGSTMEQAQRWFARDFEVYGKLAQRIGLNPAN
ncbi:tripartite tricarboxylate transporter substrate binding protein [Verticiella sediminum]|uniref:Tripartite tricarboxylate transporter substrate binding protein n=1 Tax=Verticiella sediminum TaxID=1247510 RepID=A0A556ANL0_9BURK|nr:tripartite tricarboxylate transporter substrate binding protein [Verticiella sediminum]TSH94469.1 tripartite tricarboxylate transporter substrate binding protein [Verticiella sediminum]